MKKKLWMLLISVSLLGSMLACNLPAFATGDADEAVLPNLTLTAIYREEDTQEPTSPPVVAATLEPTSTETLLPTPTKTALPPSETPTEEPTATATTASLPERSTTKWYAPFLSTPPTIDGDWGEWDINAYPMRNVAYGGENWVNGDDLEGSFRIGWDYTYLYLAVKVKDDVYKQDASGADLYMGDSIELLLDTDLYDDFYYNVLSPDDYQLGISPGRPDVNGTKEAYLWFPQNLAGTKSNVKIGSVQSEGLYRVEAAIPWSVFGVNPYYGAHFGFAVSASDNDNTSKNVQQSMVSNVSNRHLTQPLTWGELILTQ